MKMDLVYFHFRVLTLVVSLMCILLQPSSTNAEHYVTKQHQGKAVSAPSVNASKPISARSPIECVLKCKNKAGGQYTKPFYSNQNECFCLKNDQQELDTRTVSKGKEIDGLMYLKTGNNGNSLTTQSNPGSSCKSIKQQHRSSARSGFYWIDLSPVKQVYCDMYMGGVWEQQNPTTVPVCYKSKDNQHGSITIKRSETILAFKLEHVSGELKCNDYCSSYWGMHSWAPEEAIGTLITNTNKNIVAPKTDYTPADYQTFTIPGYSHKSPELVMEVPGTLGYEVTEGDVFWIWYAEDFFNGSETNNSGEHCINVYVKFSPW